MIREFYCKEIWFRDVQGIRRTIGGLPLPHRLRFLEHRTRAWSVVQNNPDLLASTLYDANADFRADCDAMLSLCAIEPQWVNWEIVLSLLFRHQDGDGLIVQQEFPATDPEAKIVEDPSNPYHRAIANLMTIGMDYLKAKEVVDTTSWDELQGVLEQLVSLRSGQSKIVMPADADVLAAWGMLAADKTDETDNISVATSFDQLGFRPISL